MASRRAVFLLGLAAAVLVGTVLRLSTYRQLRAGPRTRAVSADDYYHLRRARFSVAHFPRTIFFDPLMNFPAGGVSIWPPLFDLALAAPSRILHGPYASREAIEREAAWVPLVLAPAWVAQHPDKLAGFLCIDPTQPNWRDEMVEGHQDLKLKGIKLLPMYAGFKPNDRELDDLWRYATKHGIPVSPRGTGHSLRGQSTNDGGVVLDLTGGNDSLTRYLAKRP